VGWSVIVYMMHQRIFAPHRHMHITGRVVAGWLTDSFKVKQRDRWMRGGQAMFERDLVDGWMGSAFVKRASRSV